MDLKQVQKISKAARGKWETLDHPTRLANEKRLIEAIVNAYAQDGNWSAPIQGLQKENIEWLKKMGFEVEVTDDEDNYLIYWDHTYEWRKPQ